MNAVLEQISKIGIVPVIKIEEVSKAVPLAKALCAGGLPVAEITFRTAQAAQAIAQITKEVPEMLVGAGTVLTREQADKAIEAGAKFIVSPGFNPKVVEYCIERGVPITPGVTSPSDMELAMEYGLDVVKFFPAEAAGGVAFLKAVSAPYGSLRFMPTGGISLKNLNDYLGFSKIIACGGSWMVSPEMIAAGDFVSITELSAQAVRTMLGFELAHVGVNCESGEQALRAAKTFCAMFGMPCKEGASSVFAGTAVEYMKAPYLGKHGHIAIATRSIERAVAHLERQGLLFSAESAKRDAKGALKAIYFADEVAGFAVHLVQK